MSSGWYHVVASTNPDTLCIPSSGQSEDVLDAVLDPSFRLWDAYGMLPVRGSSAHRRPARLGVAPDA